MPLKFYKYNPLDKNKDTLYRFAGMQTEGTRNFPEKIKEVFLNVF